MTSDPMGRVPAPCFHRVLIHPQSAVPYLPGWGCGRSWNTLPDGPGSGAPADLLPWHRMCSVCASSGLGELEKCLVLDLVEAGEGANNIGQW